MGIKDLYTYLKHKIGLEATEANISIFSGQKIGIDVNNLAYKYMSRTITNNLDVYFATKNRKIIIEKWMNCFIGLDSRLRENGICPVYVFDGINIPKDKDNTRYERWCDRKERKDRVEADIEFNMNAIELKRTLHGEAVNDTEVKEGYKATMDDLKADVRIEREEMWLLRDTMKKRKWEVMIDDKQEAEEYISHLCKKGDIKAAYSEDGDMIAYRCPIIIRSITGTQCQVMLLSKILEVLGLNEDQLIMFCILLGTDYNKRIPGILMGPTKSHKLIKNIYTLDELKAYFRERDINYDCLNMDYVFSRFKN